jgi:hypothetical protein
MRSTHRTAPWRPPTPTAPEEGWTDFAPIARRLAAVKAPGDPAVWRRAAALATSLGALSSAEALLANLDRKEAETTSWRSTSIPVASACCCRPTRRSSACRLPARWPTSPPIARRRGRWKERTATPRARMQTLAAAFPDTPAANVAACELDPREEHQEARAASPPRGASSEGPPRNPHGVSRRLAGALPLQGQGSQSAWLACCVATLEGPGGSSSDQVPESSSAPLSRCAWSG